MRLIPALVATAAVAGIAAVSSAGPAAAQCSVFSRHPCPPIVVCSVFGRHQCFPTVCSVLHHEPCLPQMGYPLGQTLQLTITSADKDRKDGKDGDAAAEPKGAESSADASRKLDTIREMFDALRDCWVPPPQDEERPGMQMSVRLSFKRSGELFGTPRVTYTSPDAPPEARNVYHDAITAAIDRCTPLPFTAGLGGALAGRPIAIRFVDNRDAR
jgi:hypothetical protein